MKNTLFMVVVGAFLLAGCAKQETSTTAPEPTATPVVVQTQASPSPIVEAVNSKTFTVTGLDFSFDAKEIKVKKGDTVTIIFKNSEGIHDWKVDEFKAATKKIKSGEQDVITFVADKVGTFEYYCSVGQHRSLGMKGNLIVE